MAVIHTSGFEPGAPWPPSPDTWEARMAGRAAARALVDEAEHHLSDVDENGETLDQQWARERIEHPERFNPDTPDAPEICRKCYQWTPDNRERGTFAWFKICDKWRSPFVLMGVTGDTCTCAHHDDEVWIG